jgi:hypothetical protein
MNEQSAAMIAAMLFSDKTRDRQARLKTDKYGYCEQCGKKTRYTICGSCLKANRERAVGGAFTLDTE